jgi:hypothetical protein
MDLSTIKKKLINPHYLSYYSPQVINIFQHFKKGPISCRFHFDENDPNIVEEGVDDSPYYLDVKMETVGVSDFNKYFLSIFLKLQYLPVINFNDNFIDYDNHRLEDYNLYIIEKLNDDFSYPYYKNDICFGLFLKKIDRNRFKIHKYLRPSTLLENPLIDDFKNLYENEKL